MQIPVFIEFKWRLYVSSVLRNITANVLFRVPWATFLLGVSTFPQVRVKIRKFNYPIRFLFHVSINHNSRVCIVGRLPESIK